MIRTVTSRDGFGESANFEIKGQTEHKTMQGAVITLVILACVALFAVNKVMIMQAYEDTTFHENVEVGVIDSNEKFKRDRTRLNIAFGIYNQRTKLPMTFDQLDGQLSVSATRWSFTPDGGMKNEGAVSLNPCTADDIERFHPPIKSEEEIASFFFPTMFCIGSEEDITIQGGLTSNQQQYFTANVARCVETEGELGQKCKPMGEIDDLLEYSNLMYFYNTQTYRPNEYGELTVSDDAKFDYFPLSPKISTV